MINNYAILCSMQHAVMNTWVFHKSYRPSLQNSRVHPTTPPTLLTSFLFGKLLTPSLVVVAMVVIKVVLVMVVVIVVVVVLYNRGPLRERPFAIVAAAVNGLLLAMGVY